MNGLTLIVKTITDFVVAFIVVFGAYIVLYGHLTPGGGFAGGVVIACGFILLTIAGGGRAGSRFFSPRVASTLDSAGVVLFLLLASMGVWWAGDAFFTNFIGTAEQARFTLVSGGIIPLANLALGVKVASSLFLVFTVLAALRIAVAGHDEEADKS